MHHTVTIDTLAQGGSGVCRIKGQVCFVPEALPGERVAIRVDRTSKGVLWATLLDVIDASPDRKAVASPRHGGNGWLHFTYPAQAEWKRRIVGDTLHRLAGLTMDVDWAEDSAWRLGYRTRAEFHGDGKRVGFNARGSREIVDLEACPLLHEKLNAALLRLRTVRPKGRVELTVHPEGDDVLCWLQGPNGAIQRIFPSTNWLRDGRDRTRFVFDGVPVVNGCFSQGSLLLNRTLVREVHNAVGTPTHLLDLYCGSGNFSLCLPDDCHVTGLDHNEEAVRAAGAMGRGEYRAGGEDAFRAAVESRAWDVILLDPPRQGAKALIPALSRAHADRLVYVSCDPASLARDLSGLRDGGWHTNRITAVDMFPYTPHIEAVAELTRNSGA